MSYITQFKAKQHLIPPPWREYTELSQGAIRAIQYEGAPYRDKPTSCFAWLGLPKDASAKRRVPAIVLIHGGGGTAFSDWVEIWMKHGYAVIAMDTCGSQPAWSADLYWAPQWPRLPDGGAPGWGGFEQLDEPLADQWCYQATAAVLRGTALLRSLPEVDESRIGVAGISWGGYLTLLATTVAPQGTYRFAIPVYASAGFTAYPTSILWGRPEITPEQVKRWTDLWDPLPVLPKNHTPMLFLTDAEDVAYALPSWQQTTETVSGPVQRSMRIEFPHGHQFSFRSRTEAVFAEAMLKGKPLPVWGKPNLNGKALTCEFHANGQKPQETTLCYTRAEGLWCDRRWYTAPAEHGTNVLSAELPAYATTAFFLVKDSQGCQWSSPVWGL